MASDPEFLAIHIMKTAGTSLRGMLTDGLGTEGVYPNDADLHELPKGWYPGPRELVAHVREGRTHGARLIIGHVPYVLADALPRRPVTIALLRDPIARAVSMMGHRRTRTRRYRGASFADLLAVDSFVDRQIRDYQTKIFAFDDLDECAENVNVPLDIDDARFERAMARLERVDVVGVLEDLPAFAAQLEAVTGIRPGAERSANRGSYERAPLPADVARQLEQLTARDTLLYRRALELARERSRKRRPWWRRRRA